MATAISKLDHFKLETEFGNGYVVNAIYEWELSTRRPKGLARWRQEKLIGAGAFGSVWLEKEEHGGQLRAVKRLQKHLLIETGFSQELLALITLTDVCAAPVRSGFWKIVGLTEYVQHNHLFVQFFGWYENKEDIFFAMEYIAYGDLSEYMNDHERARAGSREITRQVLEGVNILHREGICHRDLKPQV